MAGCERWMIIYSCRKPLGYLQMFDGGRLWVRPSSNLPLMALCPSAALNVASMQSATWRSFTLYFFVLDSLLITERSESNVFDRETLRPMSGPFNRGMIICLYFWWVQPSSLTMTNKMCIHSTILDDAVPFCTYLQLFPWKPMSGWMFWNERICEFPYHWHTDTNAGLMVGLCLLVTFSLSKELLSRLDFPPVGLDRSTLRLSFDSMNPARDIRVAYHPVVYQPLIYQISCLIDRSSTFWIDRVTTMSQV